MASPYNTRSRRAASASSATVMPKNEPIEATVATQQPRRFCIVLTNNPRMIQAAQRMLQTVTINVQNETERQEHRSQIHSTRHQQLNVSIEQQVPMTTQNVTRTTVSFSARAYEKEIEEDFQAQIQPILQIYLQKTRRSNPINSVFDMSNHIEI